MAKEVVIYPRGFAGFDIGLPIRNKTLSSNQVFKSILHNQDIGRSNTSVISNTMVEDLWKKLCNGNGFISNFKFREAIIKSGLNAFGTNSFLEWIELQNNNPYLSNIHRRFINDTFNFLKNGTRSLNIQMWLQLIAGDAQDNSKVKINYQDFFGTNKPLHQRENHDINQLLIQWVSQPNGFEDLLGTLHVLFGDSDLL